VISACALPFKAQTVSYLFGEEWAVKMNSKVSLSSRSKVALVACVLGAFALVIYGFIAGSFVSTVNVIAMTIALYVASSIVIGGELKKALIIFTISVFFTITSDLCFSLLQPFIALCISLFVLLATIRYSLIRDHDSGWFGAICAELVGLVFFLPIQIIFACMGALI